MKFFNHLLSMDEAKTSALIICLLGTVAFGMLIVWRDGDIPERLATLIETLVITIGGVNAVNAAAALMSLRKSKADKESEAEVSATSPAPSTPIEPPIPDKASLNLDSSDWQPIPKNPGFIKEKKE